MKRLAQRIDLTVQTGNVNRACRKHGNRLECSTQAGSPYDFSAAHIQRKRATRLDANDAIADNGRRGHHFTDCGLPPQVSSSNFEGIEEPILAANYRKIT